MWIRFGSINIEIEVKYNGQDDPWENIDHCTSVQKEIQEQEWVHGFIHTLETSPMNWYLETELRHGTMNWTYLVEEFILTFNFEYDCSCIDSTRQVIKENIF